MLDQSYYAKADEIIDQYGGEPASLIPIMQAIQGEYRYLPGELLTYVAGKIGVTEAKACSVATFYENFSFDPKGKYVIKVCDGTACHVRKSMPVLEALYEKLGLSREKKTTDDMMFTVETVSCLGACGLAPVMTVNDKVYPSMTPDEAILDAELVKSVPPAVTADTGMDVFTHALEACVSINRSDFSTALAEKAIEICGVFLLRAYLDGNDTHARQKMHSASCLTGLAFNAASLGLNHGMAHQLGATFHIPHGRANAMLLPHIIEFNSDINKHSKSRKEYLPAVKRYSTVAQILGLSSYNKIMTVRSLVNWVQFMLKEMDIPLSISQMGTISEEEYFGAIDRMADAALADACTATNPRVPSKADVIRIYKELW